MSRRGRLQPQFLGVEASTALRAAAADQAPVSGLTHQFYRYPARFSPTFARTAIDLFSIPGDVVLDPYMGGGTTVVEALIQGREPIGSDINSLAVFLAGVKTTPVSAGARAALRTWADEVIPKLSYWSMPPGVQTVSSDRRTFNLTLPHARPIKKVVALGLLTLRELPDESARNFARCALLSAAQLFLNGQRRTRSLDVFRERLQRTTHEMLDGLLEFERRVTTLKSPVLINCSAADLASHKPFASGRRATLVVTSPPYPGIHMLYHRWQVDGRRETPAPYWMANCQDGRGNAFYNFADRPATAEDKYFTESLKTLKGIRSVMERNGIIVQLVAFSNPERQLRRYMANMEAASFEELATPGRIRIWRDVPSRRWHANFKGKLNGSREVVLVHRAI
jgi:hypothetical protein